ETTASSEVLHRPTLSRAQIQAKGKHETPKRIEDAKSLQFMAKALFSGFLFVNRFSIRRLP
ncbi:hypothetical protein MJI37_20180, partial [Salmonella enterica subsp. enterica serovar Cerro]|nr:hypothetical protein [Salmonella enterica subsp. enterica serovar Cerro]